MFSWYWVADFCEDNNIKFILSHALYKKAIHGGKAKNDKVDSHKIASLARGGTFPMAFVYPRDMRSTRDLLRRRMHLMRKQAELLCHIHNTNTQYNYDRICKNLRYKSNRKVVDGRFSDPSVQKNVDLDIELISFYDDKLTAVEYYIKKHAKIGNAHLQWAFYKAAVIFLRGNPKAKAYVSKMTKKHNKGKALSILAHKLGRAVYFMLKRKKPFNMEKFLPA
ncbi:MAG: IS110 family transposase [Bacteroidetes bacterium]|nr:IS110 family transposase [Bacteroidota bacterium]